MGVVRDTRSLMTTPEGFDDQLWREMIFNGYDDPAGVATARSDPLTGSPPA